MRLIKGAASGGGVEPNAPITAGSNKTKISYDEKGLVTGGGDATTADIADSADKRYVTDADLTVLGNTSGTNTGDQTTTAGMSSVTDKNLITDAQLLLFTKPQNNNLDFGVASGVAELTNGTPTYMYVKVNRDTKITSVTFFCQSFTSNTDYEICFYTWAASGSVSKYGSGTSATTTVTSTGQFTMTFSPAVDLVAGRYDLGILKISGSSNIAIRTGISSSVYTFLGTAAASALPATETTRNSQSAIPIVEWA